MLVLDEVLETTLLTFTTTTSAAYDSLLGVFDQLAVEAVADDTNAAGISLTLDLQHSADGETWLTKANLLPATPLSSRATTVLPVTYDDGTMPTLAFGQILVTLSGDVVPKQVRLRITVSVFDSRWRDVEDLDLGAAQVIAELHERAPPARGIARSSG